MRRAFAVAAFAAISLVSALAPGQAGTRTYGSAAAQAAAPGGVSVSMDEVTLVAFAKPISVVYMGNTVIADVTMIDSRHVFVLGKTYGVTNLIALGAGGNVVANDRVTVFGRRTGLLTLNRGAAQFNFTCTTSHCETQPVPGDPDDYFKNTHDAQTQHEDMANKAANGAVAINTPAQ